MRIADNHAGWNVEYYAGEWMALYSKPFETKDEANRRMDKLKAEGSSIELRVYPWMYPGVK